MIDKACSVWMTCSSIRSCDNHSHIPQKGDKNICSIKLMKILNKLNSFGYNIVWTYILIQNGIMKIYVQLEGLHKDMCMT